MLKHEETHHDYYCSTENYNNSSAGATFPNWKLFKEEWMQGDLELDDGLNHIFRFDIEDNEMGGLRLKLFFMLQEKGLFIPIVINYIKEEDMSEINEFLFKRWQYLKNQWIEFNGSNEG